MYVRAIQRAMHHSLFPTPSFLYPFVMPRLIVNADDLGMNPQRSHGIFTAFEQGIVRSASIIANGSDATRAAKHAREKKLSCGLHFNITEGDALCPIDSVGSLLEANGYLRDRNAQRRALDEGMIDPQHIEREARAQLEWMLEHHGQPTHVDSHHNLHVHPVVAQVLAPLLESYGIRFVRMTVEPHEPFGFEIPESQQQFIARMSAEAQAAKPLYEAHGIGSTEHFRGLALGGNASKKNLRHILSRLPDGTTELMVHPGSPTSTGTDFDRDPQRQTELNMLCDEGLPSQLRERKIELCSWADL